MSKILSYHALPTYLAACLDVIPIDSGSLTTGNFKKGDDLAAVLVPLIWRAFTWHILLTKRAAHLTRHPGQISFPGGKVDTSDNGLASTALREAREEINLLPKFVKVFGGLSPVRSPHGFIVQPVVGLIEKDIYSSLQANPAEVESIFTIPLESIRCPGNFNIVSLQSKNSEENQLVLDHPDHNIWGLSARVLKDLANRLERHQVSK